MSGLKDLIIELQMNRYAFFSSGYPSSDVDIDAMSIPFRRDTWSIARAEIVVEMLRFSPGVDNIIQS